MTIEIDVNQLVDKSIHIVILLLCFFIGMRIMYGYWPWQEGPNPRRIRPVKPDSAATLKRAEPIAAPALQPEPEIMAPQPNGTPVPAVALPAITDATGDSFDRSLIKTDEARPHAA